MPWSNSWHPLPSIKNFTVHSTWSKHVLYARLMKYLFLSAFLHYEVCSTGRKLGSMKQSWLPNFLSYSIVGRPGKFRAWYSWEIAEMVGAPLKETQIYTIHWDKFKVQRDVSLKKNGIRNLSNLNVIIALIQHVPKLWLVLVAPLS